MLGTCCPPPGQPPSPCAGSADELGSAFSRSTRKHCMVSCPLCAGPLQDTTFDDVPIQVCAAHGTWLDQGELLAITEEERWKPHSFWEDLFRDQAKPPRRDGRVLNCPICSTVMETMPYHGVIIDWCRVHGVWLDSGEMEAILNNLRLDPNYIRGVAIRVSERMF